MFWLGKTIHADLKTGEKKHNSINLSPLEVIILAQLRARELRNKGSPVGQYGYEMIQELNVPFAGLWEAKSGTIYPILSKLEGQKKMIKGKRMESPLGPVKKVYILEEIGRTSIDTVVKENFKGDIDFIIQYINMITPFLIFNSELDDSDGLFEKLMDVPSMGARIALEKAVTEVDEQLRSQKLKALHLRLLDVIKKIEAEFEK